MSNPRAKKRSNHEGIWWHENSKKWRTQVRTGKRGVTTIYYSGTFTNEIDAAKAYLEAKIRLYREKLKEL